MKIGKKNLNFKKRLLKKSAITISLAAIVSTPILTTAACGGAKLNAVLVLDEGSAQDHSFNQQSWTALQKYSSENSGFEVGTVKPNSPYSQSDFRRAYDVANYELRDQKIAILSGFLHQSIGGIGTYASKLPSTNFVGIDFNTFPDATPVNFHSIEFNAVQSGILAAIWTGIYFNLNRPKSVLPSVNLPSRVSDFAKETTPIRLATFGGLPISSVTGYMDGLQMGLNYFNLHSNLLFSDSASNNARPLKMTYFNGTGPSMQDFSGDFAASSTKATTIINQDYDARKANVILPVAGPQAQLVFDPASTAKDRWLYGIDVDMTANPQFENYYHYILGSAVKNIEGAVLKVLDEAHEKGINKVTSKVLSYKDGPADNHQSYVGFLPNRYFANSTAQNDKQTVESIIENSVLWKKIISSTAFLDTPAIPIYNENSKTNGNLFTLAKKDAFGGIS